MKPILLLQREKGRAFLETGLVVLRESHAFATGEPDEGPLTDRRRIEFYRTHAHELVHFLQSLSCAYLLDLAYSYWELSANILSVRGAAPREMRKRFEELHDLLRGCAGKPGERVRTRSVPEGELVSFVQPADTIAAADIVEGVAVVESFRAITRRATAVDFVNDMFRHHDHETQPEYSNTFIHLAGCVGDAVAYEVLSPISFISLQCTDPPATFARLCEKAKDNRATIVDICRDVKRLFAFADLDVERHIVFHLDDAREHPTLSPCIKHAVDAMGAERFLDYAANPAHLRMAPSAHIAALLPPVTVYSSDELGRVGTHRQGMAAENQDFANLVVHATALIGAAERMIYPTENRYQFCPHTNCPHYESALCFQYFTPPSEARGYENCQFPLSFSRQVGVEPSAAWSELGMQQMTVPQLLHALDETGEGNLLALVQAQRTVLIRLLGDDRYREIEWQSEVTVKQVVSGLQTQDQDELIKARMFRDAVVYQIKSQIAMDAG